MNQIPQKMLYKKLENLLTNYSNYDIIRIQNGDVAQMEVRCEHTTSVPAKVVHKRALAIGHR